MCGYQAVATTAAAPVAASLHSMLWFDHDGIGRFGTAEGRRPKKMCSSLSATSGAPPLRMCRSHDDTPVIPAVAHTHEKGAHKGMGGVQ